MRKDRGKNDANAYSIFHNAIRKCDEESRRILNRIFLWSNVFSRWIRRFIKTISLIKNEIRRRTSFFLFLFKKSKKLYKKIILVNNTIKIKGGIILKRLIIFLIMLLIFLASIGIGYFYLNTRDDQKNASKSEDLIAENNIENQTISTEKSRRKNITKC